MPIAMSAEEAGSYARDGYLLRKGLLSREEVERFRMRARTQLEQEQPRRLGNDERRQRGQDDAVENVDQGRGRPVRVAGARRTHGGSRRRRRRQAGLPLQSQDDHEAAATRAAPGNGTRITDIGTTTAAWRPT